MKNGTSDYQRCSIRLKGYDYSQNGAYFVTICTHNRECLFGDVVGEKMMVNEYGRAVQTVWDRLPNHYLHVELDEWIIMPNHVHGIVVLVGAGLKPAHDGKPALNPEQPTQNENGDDSKNNRAGFKPAPTGTKRHPLSEIVRALKTFSSRHINELRNTPSQPVWQRNYYEHIIRNDESLRKIREYIINNPTNWKNDRNNPQYHPEGKETDMTEITNL